ncbi:MAG TPA: hypothetical protein VES68_01890 [Candidatus Sulfotelmatobacter sp.]|nr:hypothetical protein [Candidatus Sulfotelmatobacter sp.]
MPSKKTEHKKSETQKETTIAYEWSAPGRPFKIRTKQYYLTALLIMLLVEIILFLFSEYLLMIVVLSLLFVTFALASTPPKEFHYRISTEGIQIEDKFFLWKELYDFYFRQKEGNETLHIRTESYLPGELTITFPSENKEKIKNILIEFLPFREYVKPTFIDKAGDWLSKNFPLENK